MSLLELLFALILLSAAAVTASLSFRFMIHLHEINRSEDRLNMAVQDKLASIQSLPFSAVYLTNKSDFTVGLPQCLCDDSAAALNGNFDRDPGHFPPEATTRYGVPITLQTCVVKVDAYPGSSYCPDVGPATSNAVKVTVSGRYGSGQNVHTLSATAYVTSPTPVFIGFPGSGSISGRVTAAENGSALKDVPVSAFGGGSLVAYTWTDANGRYRMSNLPAGVVDRLVVTLLNGSEVIVSPAAQDYEGSAVSSNGMDFSIEGSPVGLNVQALQGTLVMASATPLTAATVPTSMSPVQPHPIQMVVAGGMDAATSAATTVLQVPALTAGYHVYCAAPTAGAALIEAVNSPEFRVLPGRPLKAMRCP